MQILLISVNSPFAISREAFFGGAEFSLKLIGEKLAERGHEVHYLTTSHQNRIVKHSENYWLHTLKLRYVPWLHRFTRHIDLLNCVWAQINFEKAVERIAKNWHVNLIHFYSPYPDGYSCTRVGRRLGIPTIQRIGGKPWERLAENFPAIQKKILQAFRDTDYFLANCQYLRGEFGRFYAINIGQLDRIEVLDIGMELQKMPKANKVLNRLVNVSCFKKYQKRQDILVEMISLLKKKGKNYELVLVGDGPNRKNIIRLAKRLGVSENTKFIGWLSRKELLSVVDSAQVFVHASEYEGVSKAILEAMLLAMPIVASNSGGIDEYIIDDDTGILVDNDPERFAEAIESRINDESKLKKLGLNALLFAKDHFNPENNIIKYEEYLLNLV